MGKCWQKTLMLVCPLGESGVGCLIRALKERDLLAPDLRVRANGDASVLRRDWQSVVPHNVVLNIDTSLHGFSMEELTR